MYRMSFAALHRWNVTKQPPSMVVTLRPSSLINQNKRYLAIYSPIKHGSNVYVCANKLANILQNDTFWRKPTDTK